MSEVTPEERVRAATSGRAPGVPELKLPDPERSYITIAQACERGRVKRRTVMGWFERGLVQRFKAPNGYGVLIDELELTSFLATRRGGAPLVIDGEPQWD